MGIIVRHSYCWFNPWSRLLFAAKILDNFAVKKTSKQFNFKKFLMMRSWNDFHCDHNGWCHDYRHNHCCPYQCQWKTWARDGFRRLWISILPQESLLLLEFYVGRVNKIHSTVWLKKVHNSFSNFLFSFCKLWPNSTKTTLHRFWVIASSLGKRHNQFDIKLRYITRRKYW